MTYFEITISCIVYDSFCHYFISLENEYDDVVVVVVVVVDDDDDDDTGVFTGSGGMRCSPANNEFNIHGHHLHHGR